MKIDIASPCRGICKIDEPTQLCTGCLRSIDEITRWRTMDDDQKLAVLSGCLNRKPILEQAHSSQESGRGADTQEDTNTDNSAEIQAPGIPRNI